MMNTIWRCPHCGGSLDTAGRCACGYGHQQQQQVTFMPRHIPTGWKCPQCGRIHAPHVSTCPFCAPDWQQQQQQQPFKITWIGPFPNTWQTDGTYTSGTYTPPKDMSSISIGDPPNVSGNVSFMMDAKVLS